MKRKVELSKTRAFTISKMLHNHMWIIDMIENNFENLEDPESRKWVLSVLKAKSLEHEKVRLNIFEKAWKCHLGRPIKQ